MINHIVHGLAYLKISSLESDLEEERSARKFLGLVNVRQVEKSFRS